MTFEVEFNDGDWEIIQQYMKDRNMTIDELARQAILERIFPYDEDITKYNIAIEEYKKNPTPEKYQEIETMVLSRGEMYQRYEGDKNES
jgi:hypothetical protein